MQRLSKVFLGKYSSRSPLNLVIAHEERHPFADVPNVRRLSRPQNVYYRTNVSCIQANNPWGYQLQSPTTCWTIYCVSILDNDVALSKYSYCVLHVHITSIVVSHNRLVTDTKKWWEWTSILNLELWPLISFHFFTKSKQFRLSAPSVYTLILATQLLHL